MEDHCKAGGSLSGSKSNQRLTCPVGQAKKEVSKGHLAQGLLSHAGDSVKLLRRWTWPG